MKVYRLKKKNGGGERGDVNVSAPESVSKFFWVGVVCFSCNPTLQVYGWMCSITVDDMYNFQYGVCGDVGWWWKLEAAAVVVRCGCWFV